MSSPPGPSTASSRSPAPLRRVTANVLTDLGWLHGVFNVPPLQSVVDFLAQAQVVKFTRVKFPNAVDEVPFVALRREAIRLIEPILTDELVEVPGGAGRTTPREVACLLLSGRLQGTLEVLVNVRMSDFLRQQTSFIVMRGCLLTPYGELENSPKARQLGTVVVNFASAVGIADTEWPE
jgi:hypothetical protein